MQNDFEALQSSTLPVTVAGKTQDYRFTEPCAADLESLFDINGDDGKVDAQKAKGIRFRVIAAVVSRSDGSTITVDDARKMRNPVAKALYAAALDFIGIGKEDETGKD